MTTESPILGKKPETKRRAVSTDSKATPSISLIDTAHTVRISFAIDPASLKLEEKAFASGSYAHVYQGTLDDETVAVKQLKDAKLTDSELQEIRTEASVMAGLRSKYLVQLRGLRLDKAPYYLVMGYCSGGNLLILLKNKTELLWQRRLEIARDISMGLRKLHAHGILHVDLKSPNVLLTKFGSAKLADFGLAKLNGSEGRAYGTLAWSAPETRKPDVVATKEADLYSLGLILWELATRCVPYYHLYHLIKEEFDIQIHEGALPWKDATSYDLPPDCPSNFADLIRACCHTDPTQRPTAATLATQLITLAQPLAPVGPVVQKETDYARWLFSLTDAELLYRALAPVSCLAELSDVTAQFRQLTGLKTLAQLGKFRAFLRPRLSAEILAELDKLLPAKPAMAEAVVAEIKDKPELEERPSHIAPAITLSSALRAFYSTLGHLQLPLSERFFPIQTVSLTLNERDQQSRHERELYKREEARKEEKERKSERQTDQRELWSPRQFLEESWHQIEKPLSMADIWTTSNSTPSRRVLIEGRAGVGKSTFCQSLVWQSATEQLTLPNTDLILWVPLKQWLHHEADVDSTLEEHLALFLFSERLPLTAQTPEHLEALETALRAIPDTRTLLILDGYDEVAHHLPESSPTGRLLRAALQFPHILVTTRDYQRPPATIRFDGELVAIGFTDAQIHTYIQRYLRWVKTGKINPPAETHARVPLADSEETGEIVEVKESKTISDSSASQLEASLKQNPHLWNLAHTPLNAALLCEIYQPLLETATDSTALQLSVTQLYQKVMEHFIKRHLSKQDVALPRLYDSATLRRYCGLELDGLALLAWEGLRAQQIMLDKTIQQQALVGLRRQYPDIAAETSFLSALEFGLLRHSATTTHKYSDNPLEHTRYFIHLTLQEYLAAYHLRQVLQGHYGEEAYDQAIEWITQYKYSPRLAVTWGFLAGLTVEPGYDLALQAFWYALLSPPYDLTGTAYLRLTARCLEEANCDSRIPQRDRLLAEWQHWMRQISADFAQYNKDLLNKHSLLPLLHFYPQLVKYAQLLKETLAPINRAGRTRHYRACATGLKASAASKEIIVFLLTALKDTDATIRGDAASALGQMGEKAANHPAVLPTLVTMLKDTDEDVRRSAADALGKMKEKAASHSDVLPTLVTALKSTDGTVRSDAAWALGQIGERATSHPDVLPTLVTALKDTNTSVRYSAARALTQMESKATSHLLTLLEDAKKDIRYTAVDILDKIIDKNTSTHPEITTAVLAALKDAEKDIRHIAIKALNKIIDKNTSTHSEITTALVAALKDAEKDIRYIAIIALDKIIARNTSIHPEIITALLAALKDVEKNIRYITVKALDKIKNTSHQEVSFALLNTTLKDTDWDVRGKAAQLLSNRLGEVISHQEVVPVLLQALKDTDWDIRCKAVEALGNMGDKIADHLVLSALLTALKDSEFDVRYKAAEALGKLSSSADSYPEVIPALLTMLKDRVNIVRYTTAETLGKMGTLAANYPGVIPALLTALKDEHHHVRRYSVTALSKMGDTAAHHPEVIPALLIALKDPEWEVQYAATEALGEMDDKVASHPEVIPALLTALKNTNEHIQRKAAGTLRKMGDKATSHPEVLSVLLTVMDSSAESADKIRNIVTSHPEIISSLFTTALKEGSVPEQNKAKILLNRLITTSTIALSIKSHTFNITDDDFNFSSLSLRELIVCYQSVATGSLSPFTASDNNPWLPHIIRRIDSTKSQDSIALSKNAVWTISADGYEQLPLTDPEVMRPLIQAITKKVLESKRFPSVTFAACMGREAAYPATAKPRFQAQPKAVFIAPPEETKKRLPTKAVAVVLPAKESEATVMESKASTLAQNIKAEEKPLAPQRAPIIHAAMFASIPRSWIQNSTVLRPGQGVVCLAWPKNPTDTSPPQLYIEIINPKGIRVCRAYTLIYQDDMLQLPVKLIGQPEQLAALPQTHELTLEVMSAAQIKLIQSRLVEQQDEALAGEFLDASGQPDWSIWYESIVSHAIPIHEPATAAFS